MLRIRNNGRIHEIKIPSDQLEVVQRRCCICGCGDIATQMVTYDASDEKQAAKRIEKYCDTCVKNVYERQPVL